MTKYVLNSGGLRNNPQKGKEFLAEIVRDLGSNPKVLVTLFAQPREYWEQKFVQYEDELNERAPQGVKATFELAFPDTFEKQVKQNDIVYIHGGDDHLVQFWFKRLNIPTVWRGKVIATSSAGSNMLAKHYWTCDWRQCGDGLGILPIKFLPHFESDFGMDDPKRGPIDWQKALKELESYGDHDLPIYALKEGEFKVFEVGD